MKPCIYCGARPDLDDEIDHYARCPFVTNLWPVVAQDLADGNGFGCLGCGAMFGIGEFYTLRPFGGHDGVFCLSCDVLEVVPFDEEMA